MEQSQAKNEDKEVTTEFVHNIQNSTMNVMKQRPLNEFEAKYLTSRDEGYNRRKIVEKIIYMLPSIIAAIASLLEVLSK